MAETVPKSDLDAMTALRDAAQLALDEERARRAAREAELVTMTEDRNRETARADKHENDARTQLEQSQNNANRSGTYETVAADLQGALEDARDVLALIAAGNEPAIVATLARCNEQLEAYASIVADNP